MSTSVGMMQPKIPDFRKWLCERGAELLCPTNEWELVRFKAGSDTSIIYRNKVGGVRFCGEAEAAWKAFKSASPWRASKATRRKSMAPHVRTILDRDGDACFFCLQRMASDNMTVEHLVAVTHGGPNHISNLVLAHKSCNENAGHLSAIQKIRMHVKKAIEQSTKAARAAGGTP